MKRWFVILAIIVVCVCLQQKKTDVAPEIKPIQTVVALKPKPTQKFPPEPQQLPKLREPATQTQTQSPPEIDVDLGETPELIGKNFALVHDVRVIGKHSYHPDLGSVVLSSKERVYFRTTHVSAGSFVVQDLSSQRLFPVSSILHVKGVTEAQREQFKLQGLKEAYYHPSMKLVSLESTGEEVYDLYTQLKAQGLDARLEVLKDAPQAK